MRTNLVTAVPLGLAFITQSMAAPGDLDSSYQVADGSQIATFTLLDGKAVIQRNDGSVQRLRVDGSEDTTFVSSTGTDFSSHRMPALHIFNEGDILAMYPPRLIRSDGSDVRSLIGTDHVRYRSASDGTMLADGAFLLASPFQLETMVDSTGAVKPLSSSAQALGSGTIRWNRFVPGKDGNTYLLADLIGAGKNRVNLARLDAEGNIDSTFQPPAHEHTAIALAPNGGIYVAFEHSETGLLTVARLRNDGSVDEGFTSVAFPAEFFWAVNSLCLDPVSGGVFVGLSREFMRSEVDTSEATLYHLDETGKATSYFDQRVAVWGDVGHLEWQEGFLYVFGELTSRHGDVNDIERSLIRLEADLEAEVVPNITESPQDTTMPMGHAVTFEAKGYALDDVVSYQWYKNGRAIARASNPTFTLPQLTYDDAGHYHVTVTGTAGTTAEPSFRLDVSGQVSIVDPDFLRNVELAYPPNGASWLQPNPLSDGTVLLTGDFHKVNGQPSNGVARLQEDGSLDPTFPLELARTPWGLKLGSNGHLYGRFRDETFNSNDPWGRLTPDGEIEFFERPEGYVEPGLHVLEIQSDGKILRSLSPQDNLLVTTLFRFLPDGTLDESFQPVRFESVTARQSSGVTGLALLDDGKILVGGQWGGINGEAPNEHFNQSMVRLLPSGAVDESYSDRLIFGEDFEHVWRLQQAGDRSFLLTTEGVLVLDREGRVDPSFQFEAGESCCRQAIMDEAGQVFYEDNQNGFKKLNRDGSVAREITIETVDSEAPFVNLYASPEGVLVSGDVLSIDGVQPRIPLVRLRETTEVPIIFADSNLAQAMQALLGTETVTVGDLETVTELNLDHRGIVDLRGLENATSLTTLSLLGNSIRDFSPLHHLPLEKVEVDTRPMDIVRSSEGTLRISWATLPNESYTVESSANLKDWRVLVPPTTHGDFELPPTRVSEYFRLMIE